MQIILNIIKINKNMNVSIIYTKCNRNKNLVYEDQLYVVKMSVPMYVLV